jgi:hypothetical protein
MGEVLRLGNGSKRQGVGQFYHSNISSTTPNLFFLLHFPTPPKHRVNIHDGMKLTVCGKAVVDHLQLAYATQSYVS